MSLPSRRVPMRFAKQLISLGLVLGLLLVLGINTIHTRAQTGTDPVHVTLTSDTYQDGPIVNMSGENQFTVNITLEGGECPLVERERPVDVVLVLDTSGSMEHTTTEGLSKLDATIQAAVQFLSYMHLDPNDPISDQVALVIFSSTAEIVSDLSKDQTALETALRTLNADGGTDISAGLNTAVDILRGPNANYAANAEPVIVLLSDGQDDPQSTFSAAERARQVVGARIVTVGLGPADEVDRDTLRQIADSPEDAFFTESANELSAFYARIAQMIQPRTAASGLRVTYRVNTQYFQIVPGTINPNGQLDIESAPTTVSWTYSELDTGETATFSLDVQALGVVQSNVGDVTLEYYPCKEDVEQQISVSGPYVQVLNPTPTFTPTFTPTHTPTPPPSPTSTPTPNAVLRNTSLSTPDAPEVSFNLCAKGWWDYLPYLLALVVALLGAWWLWRSWPNIVNSETRRQWQASLCIVVRALLVGWLVLLTFLFARPLAATVCEIPESVYFWRMDGPSSGIYLTHEQMQADQPAQVSSLNRLGCVGCHFVSSTGRYVGAITGPIPGRLVITTFEGKRVTLPEIDAVYGSFSPDGRYVAVSTGDAELLIYDMATGELRNVSGATDETYGAVMPSWTADGTQIGFVRIPRSNVSYGLYLTGTSDIYLIPATGGTAEPIPGASNNGRLNYYPSFSPDGRWLAFTAHEEGGTSYSDPDARVWLLDLNTDQAQLLQNQPDASNSWPTWNRDGTQLAFNTTAQDLNFDVAVTNIYNDGTNSSPVLLRGASQSGIFEHLPQWGEPIDRVSLLSEWKKLLPWFIPLLPLLLLMLPLCKQRKVYTIEPEWPVLPQPTERTPLEPETLPKAPLEPLWKPRGALVIGLGASGWHVVTQLKKTLMDAGLGEIASNVQLLCLVAGDQTRFVESSRDSLPLSKEELWAWQRDLSDLTGTVDKDPIYRGWVDQRTFKALRNATNPKTGFQNYRIFGRIALLDNLRRADDETLWEHLKRRAQSVVEAERRLAQTAPEDRHDPDQLQVILVADLSDDVSSGEFLDVAYMVHRLQTAIGVQRVRLVGHMLTDRAVHADLQDMRHPTNTTEALRELSRFQLAVGAPFPMTYSADPDSPSELDGEWDRPLFDELYLYDGERRSSTLSNVPPTSGIYPAVADGIAVWLDTASARGNLDEWRNAMLGEANRVKQLHRTLVVSSLGLYQYRLPFTDLLEDITAQYARRVLYVLLMGNATNQTPHLDYRLVRERFVASEQSPTELVRAFYAERLGAPPDLRAWGKNWRHFFTAISRNDTETLSKAINAIQKEQPDETDTQQAWRLWLKHVVEVILNGQATEQTEAVNPVLRRGAKLSLAIAFLEALANSLQGLQRTLPLQSETDSTTLAEQLEQFAQSTKTLHEHLLEIGTALGIDNLDTSLYAKLTRRIDRFKRYWERQKNLLTREYITTDAEGHLLREVWYQRYILQAQADQDGLTPIEQGVRQLYWHISDDLQPALKLSLPGEDIAFDSNDPESFEAKLLELGRYFARAVRQRENLASILEQQQLAPDNLERTVQQLRQNSNIMLGTDENARNMRPGIILSAHEGITRAKDLQNYLQRLSAHDIGLRRLQTTDPFSLTLIQTGDAIVIESVSSLHRAREKYMQEMRLDVSERERQGYIEPVAVFEAEATALKYERDLWRIREPARLFHPVVVTGLANRVKAETYLLSVVLGRVQKRGNAVHFTFPDGTSRELLSPEDLERTDSPGWLMDGLLRFVGYTRGDDGTLRFWLSETEALHIQRIYLNDEEALEKLETWLDEEHYRAWAGNFVEPERNNKVIVKDLVSITRILIDRELE